VSDPSASREHASDVAAAIHLALLAQGVFFAALGCSQAVASRVWATDLAAAYVVLAVAGELVFLPLAMWAFTQKHWPYGGGLLHRWAAGPRGLWLGGGACHTGLGVLGGAALGPQGAHLQLLVVSFAVLGPLVTAQGVAAHLRTGSQLLDAARWFLPLAPLLHMLGVALGAGWVQLVWARV
jgi:hypothetical protein